MRFSSFDVFCQGPPGTGKSHVITILVWETTRNYHGSLVLSRYDNETKRESHVSDDLTRRVFGFDSYKRSD